MLAREASRPRRWSASWISTAESAQSCSPRSSMIAVRAPPRRWPASASAASASRAQADGLAAVPIDSILGAMESAREAFELSDLPRLEARAGRCERLGHFDDRDLRRACELAHALHVGGQV